MIFAAIFVGATCVAAANSKGQGFFYFGLTAVGYGILGCVAALVLGN